MHYRPTSFTKNGNPTIESVPPGIPFQQSGLSAGDIEGIYRMHGRGRGSITLDTVPSGLAIRYKLSPCSSGSFTIVAAPVTIPVSAGQTVCMRPDASFEAPSTGEYGGARFQFSSWSDGGALEHQITVSGSTAGGVFQPATGLFLAYHRKGWPHSATASPAAGGSANWSAACTVGAAAVCEYTTATFTAAANGGYRFLRWNSLNPPGAATQSALATGARDVQAEFTTSEVISVSSSPAGRTISVAGGGNTVSDRVPRNFTQTAGGYSLNATPALQISQYTDDIRFRFLNWSGGGSNPQTVTTPGVYTANFQPEYLLDTTATPNSGLCTGNSISVAPGAPASDGFYAHGTPLTLTANPAQGWSLTSWVINNVASGTANPLSVAIGDQLYVTAKFLPPAFAAPVATSLTPSTAPAGSGSTTVTIDGSNFNAASKVLLNGSVAASYAFVNSTRMTVVIPSSMLVSPGSITVTVRNVGYSESTGCSSATFNRNFSVQTSSQYTLATTASPVGGGTTAGGGSYASGVVANISATANTGFIFHSWTATGGTLGSAGAASTTLTMPAASVTATARFCSLAVSPVSANVGAGAQNGLAFSVTTQSYCSWTAASGAAFLTGGGSGTGSGTVSFNVAANLGAARSGAINVTLGALSAQHTVNQSAASYSLIALASPAAAGTVGGGGSYEGGTVVNVSAQASPGWTFQSWTSAAGSFGNTGSAATTFTMPLAAVTVTARFCDLSVSPTASNVGPAGQNGLAFNVVTQSYCSWTAVPGSAFLTGGGSGTGSGTVTFHVAANGGAARSGAINVTTGSLTAAHTVNQEAVYPLTTVASPGNAGTAAGAGSFAAGAAANISASANPGFVFHSWTTTGGTLGNAGAAATTVTMPAAAVTATARFCDLVVSPSASNIGPGAQNGLTFNVSTQPYCSWTAAPAVAFLTGGGSGTGSGAVSFNAAANGGAARSGAINVTLGALSATHTVNQAAVVTYALTTASSPAAGGTTAGGGNYVEGAAANIAAAASPGFFFHSWTTTGGALADASAANTALTMPASAASATARFCDLTLSHTELNTGPAAQSGLTFTVVTQPYCSWTAAPAASFITGGGAGTGTGTVAFSIAANSGPARPGAINVTLGPLSAVLTVNQGAVQTFALSLLASPPEGGTATGAGNYPAGTVANIAATANAGFFFHSWLGSGVTPANAASAATSVTTPASAASVTARFCNLTLSPLATPVGAGAQTGLQFAVNTQPYCSWTATSGAAFLTGGASGTGSGLVQFDVAANPGAARSGAFNIVMGPLAATHTVNQGAVATFPLVTQPLPASGGSTTGGGSYPEGASTNLTASANAGFAFHSWTTTGGTLANPSAPATALTMPAAPVTATARFCDLSVTPGASTAGAGGQAGLSFTVSTQPYCAWTATPAAAFLSGGGSGTGPGVVTFTAAANSGAARSGTINITAGALTAVHAVNQAGGAASWILVTSAGTPQSAVVGTAFSALMQAKVTDAGNNPVQGASVTFTAPSSGASGSFGGSSAVSTNAGGIATAPAFTANSTAGTYEVTAAIAGGSRVKFNLTNTPPANGGAPPPQILSPANNATLTNSVVTFQWTPAPGSSQSYDFRLLNQTTGALVLKLTLIGGLTSQVYTLNSGSYRLEMRTCNPACGAASVVNFAVALPAISGSRPDNLACSVANDSGQNRVDCNWPAVAGADFYFINVIQQGAGPGGGALTVAGKQVGATSVSLPAPNGTLFVIVRACNGDGCGPQSLSFQVTAAFGNPSVPVLAEPFGGSVIDAGSNVATGVFTWSRVAGDNGSNYRYRLYVQDFSRNAPAVDILTSSNFHAAHLNPATRYDALVIAIPTGGGAQATGPAQGFLVKGRIPNAPSFVGPSVFSVQPAGNVELQWTPVPQANGDLDGRLYEFDISNGSQRFTGVTANHRTVQSLPPGAYTGWVRVCNNGTNCAAGNDAGWGPRSGTAGAEGGAAAFTVQ
ncbi:MAG: hypothetical protein FJW39_10625 [Acidobacteria bacterium]|nr:hypothetical protein [Acidobacteriota bacterium]